MSTIFIHNFWQSYLLLSNTYMFHCIFKDFPLRHQLLLNRAYPYYNLLC